MGRIMAKTALRRSLFVAIAAAAGATSAAAVASLSFDQLLSVVFWEDEEAYLDTKTFFCRNIALDGEDDLCNASMRVIDPAACKVEVIRQFRATYDGGKGREFMLSRDVYTLANVDLEKIRDAEIDEANQTARQSFESQTDIYRGEGYRYTYALDEKGAYKACRVDGIDKDISEPECVKAGIKLPISKKKMTLAFNLPKYNRAMAAVRWLQKNYCPSNGEPL